MLTLPVGALWGVGAKSEAALARFGITQVAELIAIERHTLQTMVGQAFGNHLYYLARGLDYREIETSRVEHSISNETTFLFDQTDNTVISGRLLGLCDQVAGRLRAAGVMARTIAVKVRRSDFSTVNRSKTLESGTDLASDIYPVAQKLVESVDMRGQGLRLVGVRAEHLVDRMDAAQQVTLEQAAQDRDFRNAELALDMVRAKFGGRAARLGATLVGESR
jgi:DNA polymerase-4